MNELQLLKERVRVLEDFIQKTQFSSDIPLKLDQALQGRGFVKSGGLNGLNVPSGGTGLTSITAGSILKGNGISAIALINPLSGDNTYYASPTSGGSPTTGLNFTDGVLTSVS